MALTLGSSLLFTASLLVAACALFWPQLETLYLQSQHAAVKRTGSTGTKCPLGYEGPMPADHPSTGKQQQQLQQGEGPVLAGATSLPTPAAAAAAASAAGTSSGPQHVFVNGQIWTANPQVPWASSMSVDAATGEITHLGGTPSSSSCTQPGSSSSSAAAGAAAAGSCSAAGADEAAAAAAMPAGSTVVDLQGAFVMPGFVDPHVHLIFGGLSLSQVNLRGASSRQEVAARVAAAAAAAEDGGWLLGGGWSESNWGGQLPDASWLDEAAGSHPVFLPRMDYHMALVNTAALQQAGLVDAAGSGCGCSCGAGSDTTGGCSGGVDRDPATGQPTGLLRERAMDLVRPLIPSPSVQQRKAALAAACSYLLSRGVTSVGDMGWGVFGDGEETWLDLEQVYDAAVAARELPIRVSSYVPLRTWRRAAARLQANGTHHPSGRLIWGGVKEFADGSLGSSTAVFWRPYADDPTGSNTGTRLTELGDLQQLAQGAAGAGLQIAVHAIGDRAVDEVLEVFEQLEECTEVLEQAQLEDAEGDAQQQQRQAKCMQHRMEHVQHISSSITAAKLAVLGLHAVPNPQHLISDRAMLVPKLGRERAGPGRTHAYRTLATMGVTLGFASDWPVVEVDPFASVYASVFRKAPPAGRNQAALAHDNGSTASSASGGSVAPIPQPPPMPEEQPWAPEESMPLEVAMQLHTATAAKVARLEQWAGQLRPGLRGDFAVLDRSPLEGMDEYGGGGFGAGLPTVLKTYVDGRCVYGCDGGDVAGGGAPAVAVESR